MRSLLSHRRLRHQEPTSRNESQPTANDIPTTQSPPTTRGQAEELTIEAPTHDDPEDDLKPTTNLQHGVKAAEAITLSWSRNALIAAYVK